MEKTKWFKSKLHMVIYIIILLICLLICIWIGKTDFSKDKMPDNVRFSNLYNLVPEDNLYEFINASDALTIVNGRSGILLLAFPSNKWANNYARLLNKVAKDFDIDKLYYYDFLDDRENNNGTYETIVNRLNVYVPVSDTGNKDILSPTVVFIKNGDIIAYFDDVTIMKGTVNPNDYYDVNEEAYIMNAFRSAFNEYVK